MTQSPERRNSFEAVAAEFLDRYRRGEQPSLDGYARDHPGLAAQIRELFPALILMEEAARSVPPGSGETVAADWSPPEMLGDYRILRVAGRGGMGVVYEAVQEPLGRPVALKVLPPAAARDRTRLQRFFREARTAARLHHTHIVPVFGVGEERGVHYYTMQFIRGRRLDEVLAELRRLGEPAGPAAGSERPAPDLARSLAGSLLSGRDPSAGGATPVPENDTPPPTGDPSLADRAPQPGAGYYRSVARIGAEVAEALAYAHARKVVHRDIKPSNLLLDPGGSVWVADFGLAKEEGDDLTRTGDVVGTLRYIAPEQFAGVSDARSDIYGLGLTLYELLTLRPAFDESDRAVLIRRVTQQEPSRPRQLDRRVPRDLETTVLKAMAKEPRHRYASATEMAEDLRRFLADRPILARRTSWREHAWRWSRRNPGWAATLAAAFTLLMVVSVGGTVLSLSLRDAISDARNAEREKTEKLWQSYLDRARAERRSGRVGQRFKSLETLREAAKIRETPELRNEAVAALVLPDVELVREWDGYPEGTVGLATDAALERYARLDRRGEVAVCRRAGEGEEVLFRLPAHGRPPFGGPWVSPDGRVVAYGHSYVGVGVAGGLRVWRLDGPAPAVLLDEPAGYHQSAVVFRPGGRHLAVGHADKTVSVYDLATGLPCRRFEVAVPAERLAFHPHDGRLAATCGNAVQLFDVDAGRELPPLRRSAKVTWTSGLAWHPDGRHLATSDEAKLHLWDAERATEVAAWDLPSSYGTALAFNHAGDRLLSADWGGNLQLWDATTGRPLLLLPNSIQPRFGRGDELLGIRPEGGKLQLWRLADGRELRMLRRRGADTVELTHSPVPHSGGRVVAANSGPWLCFFDLDRGAELASVRLKEIGSAYPVNYLQDGGWLTGGRAGLWRWPVRPDPDRNGGLLVGPPKYLGLPTSDPWAGSSRDGRVLVIPRRSEARVLDPDRPRWHAVLAPVHDVRRCAVSPDGHWVVTCSHFWDEGIPPLRVWEATTARHVHDLPVAGGGTAAAFSPDGRLLATSATGVGCQLWEVGTWRELRRFPDITCRFSPDGRLLALGGDPRGAIRLVEAEGGREVVRLTGPEPATCAPLAFNPDGSRLFAHVSGNKAIFVWNLRLIRARLREQGLDWDGPEYPPVAPERRPVSVRVDPGLFRIPEEVPPPRP